MAIHILKYVPECPRCQSKNTGFDVYGTYEDLNLMIYLANRGMKIRYRYYPCNGLCFCEDCDYEWVYRPKFKIMKKAEYIQLRKDKNIDDFVKQLKEKKIKSKINKEKQKWME